MTAEWVEWTPAEASGDWDRRLSAYADFNLYQAYRWGEFKRRQWLVHRGGVRINGAPAAMAQWLVRELPALRLAVIWIPGGPVGTPDGRRLLLQALRQRYRGWRLCVRMNALAEPCAEELAGLTASGWRRPAARLAPAQTIHLDLTPEEPARRAALAANWRHNLIRGQRRTPAIRTWEAHEPLEPVYAVYQEMLRYKGLRSALTCDELQAIRALWGPDMTLVVALTEQGTPCALRACIRTGARAQDFLAAVSPEGRRRYAAYPVLWRLLELARAQGAHLYDLNGVDPEGAAGVFNFKRGLGGRLVPLIGEWEWATAAWLRWGVNAAVRWRSPG